MERTDLEAQHKTSAMHGLLKSYLQQQHDLECAAQVERHDIECKHLIDSHEQVRLVALPVKEWIDADICLAGRPEWP